MPGTWRWEWRAFPRADKIADSNDSWVVRHFLQYNRIVISMTTDCGWRVTQRQRWSHRMDSYWWLLFSLSWSQSLVSVEERRRNLCGNWVRRGRSHYQVEFLQAGKINHAVRKYRLFHWAARPSFCFPWHAALEISRLLARKPSNYYCLLCYCVIRWRYTYC